MDSPPTTQHEILRLNIIAAVSSHTNMVLLMSSAFHVCQHRETVPEKGSATYVTPLSLYVPGFFWLGLKVATPLNYLSQKSPLSVECIARPSRGEGGARRITTAWCGQWYGTRTRLEGRSGARGARLPVRCIIFILEFRERLSTRCACTAAGPPSVGWSEFEPKFAGVRLLVTKPISLRSHRWKCSIFQRNAVLRQIEVP